MVLSQDLGRDDSSLIQILVQISNAISERIRSRLNLLPNKRPELCPRHCISSGTNSDKQWNHIFDKGSSILTVGDGDFSFSCSLAHSLISSKNTSGILLPTSYESGNKVLTVYPLSKANLDCLKSLGVSVLHDIDATRLKDSLHAQSIPSLRDTSLLFDVVVWNFPCVASHCGADGQAAELEENKSLLAGFFHSVHSVLTSENALVMVTHKTIEPFSWWGIVSIADEADLHFVGAIVFDR